MSGSAKKAKMLVTLVVSLIDVFETMPDMVIQNVLILLTQEEIVFVCTASPAFKAWCIKYLREKFWRMMYLSDTRYNWIVPQAEIAPLMKRQQTRNTIEAMDVEHITAKYVWQRWTLSSYRAFHFFSQSSGQLLPLRASATIATFELTNILFDTSEDYLWDDWFFDGQSFLGEESQTHTKSTPLTSLPSVVHEIWKTSAPSLVVSLRDEKASSPSTLFLDVTPENTAVSRFFSGSLLSLEREYMQFTTISHGIPVQTELEVYEMKEEKGFFVVGTKTDKRLYKSLDKVTILWSMRKNGERAPWEISHSSIVSMKPSYDFFDQLILQMLVSKDARMKEWEIQTRLEMENVFSLDVCEQRQPF